MKPEEKAREKIDELLKKAGWMVQDYKELNLSQSLGVAVGNFPLKTGFADYLLFVDRSAVGVIEAKPEGTTLSGVSEQTEKYLFGVPEGIPHVKGAEAEGANHSTCSNVVKLSGCHNRVIRRHEQLNQFKMRDYRIYELRPA